LQSLEFQSKKVDFKEEDEGPLSPFLMMDNNYGVIEDDKSDNEDVTRSPVIKVEEVKMTKNNQQMVDLGMSTDLNEGRQHLDVENLNHS